MKLFQTLLNKANLGKKSTVLAIVTIASIMLSIVLVPTAIEAKSSIYVDVNAHGEMDGSSSKPFNKIQDAIDKAAKKKKDVTIRRGTYIENITIKEDVEVNGDDKNDVIIIARDKNEPVVKMEDDAVLRKVTVKDGEQGVQVKESAHATIDKCIIKDNDRDGIKALKADVDDAHKLEIYNSKIENNGLDGIFAEKRKISISNNEVIDNDKDGIELAEGTKGYLGDNSIRKNGGDGIKFHLDGSDIWTKDNTYNDNKREGVEVRAHGKTGRIALTESKFYNNNRFGIAKVETAPFSDQDWNKGLILDTKNEKYNNRDGFVSDFIRAY